MENNKINIAEILKDCPFSLGDVKFRETAHIAYEDEYVTAYQSTDIVPTIYKTVKTPRDKNGLASGKPETYYCTQSSGWATEEIFVKYYQKIREKQYDRRRENKSSSNS